MTSQDKKDFFVAMSVCYSIIGVAPEQATIDSYFGILSKYDLLDVQQAIQKCLSNLKTRNLPMPGEIKDYIEGKDDDKIDFAFEDAKKMIKECGIYYNVKMFDGISQQIIMDIGGLQKWDELTHGKSSDQTNLYFEWKRMYKNYLDKMKKGEWEPEDRPLVGYGTSYDNGRKYSVPIKWGYTEDNKTLKLKYQNNQLKLEA